MKLEELEAITIEPEERPGGWRSIGQAKVWCAWDFSADGPPNWVADFEVCGVRDGNVLVRYLGGVHGGTEHGTGRGREPFIWVSASAFSHVEIYGQFRPETREG